MPCGIVYGLMVLGLRSPSIHAKIRRSIDALLSGCCRVQLICRLAYSTHQLTDGELRCLLLNKSNNLDF